MPILDAKTVFAREVTVSGPTATVLGGTATWNGAIASGASQIVDQDKAGDAVGQELTIKAVVGGTAAVGGSTTSTVTIALQTSDTTTVSDFKDLILTPAIKVAGMKPGDTLACFRVPEGTKRYLRATVTVGGASIGTAGAFPISIYATRDL
jgi:hypothetical protein